MNISIIGTGYVGLTTGLCLAEKGHTITCYDINKSLTSKLNKGIPSFFEPGLKKLLKKQIKNKKFQIKHLSANTHFNSKAIIITVGTPSKKKKIDLMQIKKISIYLGKYLKNEKNFISIIFKSTIPPGTTDNIIKNILEKYSNKKLGKFGLGMNPEFLREGQDIEDFMNPDRIVIGYEDSKTKLILKEIYKYWKCDKLFVNSRTAEMIKYANNSILALQISAMNELSNISSSIGQIDIDKVISGVHLDKRWNPFLKKKKRQKPEILNYLIPGCGFGGSCFPKDLEALISIAKQKKIKSNLFKEVLNVNKNQPYEIIKILKQHTSNLNNKKFMVLGLSFKQNTDDIRDSISVKIINLLKSYKVKIFAHDPVAIENAKKIIKNKKNVFFIKNWQKKIANVDILLLFTKWDEYKKLLIKNNSNKLKNKILFDARRMFKKKNFPKSIYLTVGTSFKNQQ